MDCPRCGQPLEGDAAFCSNCGLRVEPTTRTLQPTLDEPAAEQSVAVQRQGCRTALTVGGVALLVVLLVGALTAAAVYLGLRDRERGRLQRAEEFYQQGETYLAQGQADLAIAAYDQALALDPSHSQAARRREEASAMLSAEPTATPGLQEEAIGALWEAHVQSVAQRDWERVIDTGESLLARDPGYRAEEIRANLYDAYVALGDQAVADDRLEEALRYYDLALALRPTSSEVIRAQSLARLYVDGVRLYGADWAGAISHLSELYAMDPTYKDVAVRLRAAYVAYGQQLSAEGLWCDAVDQYTLALQLAEDGNVAEMAQIAAEQCSAIDADGDGVPDQPTVVPSGTYVGRETQPEAVGADKIYIRGHVYDANGNPVVGTRVKIQAWDFFTYAITDGAGQFSFDGLANPVRYTLTLEDLPSLPLEVETAWGRLSWVVFEQAK